ncbi:MAG TPA: MFS transporter [Anaeromyxobacteraceae bacterium]|nr:MFS transporter [Anaeromyxobacteraceae bacterium]
MRHSLRALRHRNFRLFLSGQIISLIGTWMQTIALGWLIYRLTRSPFLLGLAGFVGQIPSLFFAPLAGVWADRWNRHRMVIGTQVLAMVQALVLAFLVLTGSITIFEILALSLFLGLVTAVDVPARQSFLVEMVAGREDLPNAIALNSSAFNAARLVGPAIAGVLIGLLGEGMVFLLNGLSYVAVIAALLAVRVPPRPQRGEDVALVWTHLKDGFRYAAGFAPIRAVLLLVALVSLLGLPYTVLLPMFATDVLHGDAHTLGFLAGGVGVGALVGALYLASRRSVRGLGRVIVAAVTLLGLGLMAFSAIRNEWVAIAILCVTGFGMMAQMASSNTILQTLVEDNKRGRVMSIYTMAFLGTTPIGSLMAGALAARVGARTTVLMGGLSCLLGAALFARALPGLRRQVLPHYARLGLLAREEMPPAVGGDSSAQRVD